MELIQIELPKTVSHTVTMPQRVGIGVLVVSCLYLLAGMPTGDSVSQGLALMLTIGGIIGGAMLYVIPKASQQHSGVRNEGILWAPLASRQTWSWMLAFCLTILYVFVYWYPSALEGAIRACDPLAMVLTGHEATRWFFYGMFYTVAVILAGIRMLIRYRHSRYQRVRTASVMFFQLVFAFLIPGILEHSGEPSFYLSYFWPLKYDYFFPSTLAYLWESPGVFGRFFAVWALVLAFPGVIVMTHFFGKRWYCSWVCGCGAMAETAGDTFRHLSDKSIRAWRFERYSIHAVLGFIVLVTALVWLAWVSHSETIQTVAAMASKAYGFIIGAAFSGVIGVGFYPLLGSRVWCRFGCPAAAILGMLQKWFSRFRITTNGGQCISCGNCSKYCEMGIDVRWYAQRGQDIKRSSCVGCGICSEVCPRGVLRLESK